MLSEKRVVSGNINCLTTAFQTQSNGITAEFLSLKCLTAGSVLLLSFKNCFLGEPVLCKKFFIIIKLLVG